MSDLLNTLREIRIQVLKASPRQNLVEWADQNRYLSAESSSTPGKWSTDLVEAARGPMLAVSEKGVSKITVMGPTQLLKTELINNIVGYFISQDPSPVIVMQPIGTLADTWSTDRLDPMIRDTPALRGLIKDKRERDSGNTKLHKSFPGGHITVVSAGSPSDVASRPVRVVLMDEIDKYKTSGSEGDPEKLIEQRLETFWNALSVAVCSPTNEGSSKIAARFAESDQRFFHGRCPHCDEYDRLVWSQVKWTANDPNTTRYECSHCEEPWTETERLKAVSNGTYIATKPFNGHAGFSVNAIASPWQPLSRLVEKFLESKHDQEKLKVFVNTSLAETWKPKVDVPDHTRLYERREQYPIGTVPNKEIAFLTMGVDVQADRLEAQVFGWTKDKQRYSIDYRVFVGPTHTDEPWTELHKLIQSTYPVLNSSRRLPIALTCVDSGFNTSKVYDFVSKFSVYKVRAIKGSDSQQTAFKQGSPLSPNLDGSKRDYSQSLWVVGSSHLKQELYSNLLLASPLDGEEHVPNYCHFPEYDMDFFLGLASEALVAVRKGSQTVHVWEKQRARNEQLDTAVYARAAAAMYGLDRFSSQEWKALEGEDETVPPKPMVQKPKPQNPIWKNPGLKRRF